MRLDRELILWPGVGSCAMSSTLSDKKDGWGLSAILCAGGRLSSDDEALAEDHGELAFGLPDPGGGRFHASAA